MAHTTARLPSTDVDRDGTQFVQRLINSAQHRLFEGFGVTLSVHGDFEAFAAVDRLGWHTFQGYTNEHTHASRGAAILIDVDGRTIATYACGLYDAHPNMAALIDGPGLYNDGTGDRFEIATPVCRNWFSAMRGRVGCSGGIWMNPDYRRTALSHTLVPLLPLLGRAIAVECWQADHVFALMPEDVVKKQIGARYRLSFMEPGLTWHHGETDIAFWFGYHPPLKIVHDAYEFLEQGFQALFDQPIPTKAAA
ncbi:MULTISPECIES: hypothetical protein [Thalassobaculum]|nr:MULTISPECIES: hypothetical protein [Thalassobaculum]